MKKAVILSFAGLVLAFAAQAWAGTFSFTTGDPDGLIATASRPASSPPRLSSVQNPSRRYPDASAEGTDRGCQSRPICPGTLSAEALVSVPKSSTAHPPN